MSNEFIGVVTTIGQAKLAASIGGQALDLDVVRVGDGNGASIVPHQGMTDLVRRVGTGYQITASAADPDNPTHWRVTAVIPASEGPFDIREIGVFDVDGDLIAVARHVLVEKRAPGQGTAIELVTDIVFPVSGTAQITVHLNPSLPYLTKPVADGLYEPLGNPVQQVHPGDFIAVTGARQHPYVHVDIDALDNRYRGKNEPFPLPNHGHPNATQLAAGFMSAGDKTKLDGINIFGGTSIMNKVLQVEINTPTPFVDLTSLPNFELLHIVGMGLLVSPDVPDPPALDGEAQRWSTPAVGLQTGTTATLFQAGADYGNTEGYHVLSADQTGVSAPFTASSHVPHKRRTASGIGRGGLLSIGILNLGRATAKTSFIQNAPVNAFGNLTALLYDTTTGDAYLPGAFGRTAAVAENRIRLLCPGRQWTAGRVMVYAVAA